MSTGLYIHIPFCISKCFYCSFASWAGRRSLLGPYLSALRQEASLYRGEAVETVYIGGGTPTLLDAAQLRELFSLVRDHFVLRPACEVTVEANPATFGPQKADLLLKEGVNRVSLGVQSLNDKYLRWLGRPHTKKEAVAAFRILRRAGFCNINLDLIYSLPGQSREEIGKDARALAALRSEHLSLYALAVSDGSRLAAQGIVPVLPQEQAVHYRCVTRILKQCGFRHYEVSNFSRPGFECRHNMSYWKGRDYIGLGAAAHSHRSGLRFWNVDDPARYIEAMRRKGHARAGEERLAARKRFMETLLIGLRLSEGVDQRELEERFGCAFPASKNELLRDLVRHRLLAKKEGRIRPTLRGMVVLDEICSRLI